MTRRALIKNGKVVNIIEAGSGFRVEGHEIVDVGNLSVHIGDTYENAIFNRAPELVMNPTALKKRLAENRWRFETSGVKWKEHDIDTSRESQAMLTGIAVLAFRKGIVNVDFKFKSGFVSLGAVEINELTQAVADHVQGVFTKEAAAILEIDAGTITTFKQIDAIFKRV